VRQANFYTGTWVEEPGCDFWTARRVRVLVLDLHTLEDGDGQARTPGYPLRRAASGPPPGLLGPGSERRPHARPALPSLLRRT
jgi:hypothetical protein